MALNLSSSAMMPIVATDQELSDPSVVALESSDKLRAGFSVDSRQFLFGSGSMDSYPARSRGIVRGLAVPAPDRILQSLCPKVQALI